MPETPIGAGSPEAVAYELFEDVKSCREIGSKMNKDWILSTYAECLNTVRNGTHKAGQYTT